MKKPTFLYYIDINIVVYDMICVDDSEEVIVTFS